MGTERDRVLVARSNALRRQRRRNLLLEARDGPCVDCATQLPAACMELDHVRGEKLFHLGVSATSSHGMAAIRAEIAKCDVRCPNCHRLRHYHERGPYVAPAIPALEPLPAERRREAQRSEVLALREAGRSVRGIAAELGIPPSTVHDYVRAAA